MSDPIQNYNAERYQYEPRGVSWWTEFLHTNYWVVYIIIGVFLAVVIWAWWYAD